jgi:hypothetical protein
MALSAVVGDLNVAGRFEFADGNQADLNIND